MKDLNLIKLQLDNKGDKIIIVDNLMTVNHSSKRDNYDLNLIQECKISKMPSNLPVVLVRREGELNLVISDRSKCIYFNDSDIDTINQLKDLFDSFLNPNLDLKLFPFNDSREKSNPKGFNGKKNKLDFYKNKTDNKEIIDINTVVFEPSLDLRIIVMGNLIGMNSESKSETYDLNKITDYKTEDNKEEITFTYPKSKIIKKVIEFNETNSVLQKQFEDFLDFWKVKNNF